MLATSKNVIFRGHNQLLTTGTDNQISASEGDNQSVGSSVKVVSRCVDLEILKVILRRCWHGGYLVDNSGFWAH